MYRVTKYIIHQKDELYEYCDKMARLANNMYNVSLFYIRQVLTATDKLAKGEKLQENEIAVLAEIEVALPAMNACRKKGKPFVMPSPKKKTLGYEFLDALFKVTNNSDYTSELPKQTSQNMIKLAVKAMKGFFESLKSYKQDASSFSGRPKLPHYKKSGGICTLEFTNQDAVLRDGMLKLPKTKLMLSVGNSVTGKLKTVQIKPYYGNFVFVVTYDDGITPVDEPAEANRIAAIDFGVNNIAAIANNADLPGLLFKGGIIKAENQWFNRKRASIMHGLTVGQTKPKQFTCRALDKLSMRRDGVMRTYMHTLSNKIIAWCIENNIDTLVLGRNKDWKQEVDMGAENNQSFVSMPFYQLQQYLHYKGANNGIRVIEQEESYTSKASFLDNDDIPVYKKSNDEKYKFSGHRVKRGLYKSHDGTIINADLNGAGNILRKAYPEAFQNASTYRFLTEIKSM